LLPFAEFLDTDSFTLIFGFKLESATPTCAKRILFSRTDVRIEKEFD